jgi:hypothetical protein
MRVIYLESKVVNYHPIIHQLHLVCLILGQVARIYERVIQNRKFIGLIELLPAAMLPGAVSSKF